MSKQPFTSPARSYRPLLHFTPPSMWMNDPNGMVFDGEQYHLFYQYYPHTPVWGPMHWGHAVSKDLLHWEHLPVALEPDELGYIFSGSAVWDNNNTSQLGVFGKTPLVAVYTSHLQKNETEALEQQSAAVSLDGVHFQPLAENPVIANPGISDFRDPKVFWNPVKSCWSLVLAAYDRVHFYASPDLRHWEKTGEFGPAGNFASGVWECPDLFPLTAPDGSQIWVLLVSMTTTEEDGRAFTQYFLGNFDGDTFYIAHPFETVERIDFGFDDYAGVTFQNAPERTFLGWAINWGYANATPTGMESVPFRGQMTLPRTLSLIETPKGGLRLAAKPTEKAVPLTGVTALPENQKIPLTGLPESRTFALHIKGKGPCAVTLSNENGERLIFGVNDKNQVYIDRGGAGQKAFSDMFASPPYSAAAAPRFYDGDFSLEAVFDVSLLEVYIDHGTRVGTMAVFPETPYTHVSVNGGEGALYFIQK